MLLWSGRDACGGFVIVNIFRRLFKRQCSELRLREAVGEDLLMVRSLLILEASNGHFSGLTTHKEVESYITQLQAAMSDLKAGKQIGVFLQMLAVGREPVGFVILRACPDPSELELHMLVISPPYRRKGYARKVVKWFVDDLNKSNRRLLVRCLPASDAMMALLRTLGFHRKPSYDVCVRHFLSPPIMSSHLE